MGESIMEQKVLGTDILAELKAKIPDLQGMALTRANNLPPAVVTGFEDTTYGTDDIIMHLDTKDLATGGVSVQELALTAATANTGEAGGQAGIMTAFQATQLNTLATELPTKQDLLVSGTNIKTINGESLLGEGDIQISGGGGGGDVEVLEEWGTSTTATLSQNFLSTTLNAQTLALGLNSSISTLTAPAVALGYNNKITATSGVTVGYNNQISANYGIGYGAGIRVGGQYGTAVGGSAYANAANSVAVGYHAQIPDSVAQRSVAIGASASCGSRECVALGYLAGEAASNLRGCVSLGASSSASRDYEVAVGNEESLEYRFIGCVEDGEHDHDAVNVEQLREHTIGDVLYASAEPSSSITLSTSISQYEKVEIIGSWNMPHSAAATPLQIIGFWHLNDQDNSRTFQLQAIDIDTANAERTEVVDTWNFTNPVTLGLLSNAMVSGNLTDPTVESSDTPYITITKVIGFKAI